MNKYRGVFEKEPGSGVWWIQYFDANGQRHREKAGTRATVIKLVELRRTHRLEGRKMPKPRTRPLTFRDLTEAALAHTNGQSGHRSNVSRMKHLVQEFGDHVAEEITPEEVESWLDSSTEWTLATRNRHIALLKLTFRLAEKEKKIKFNPARLVQQKKENNSRLRWLQDKEETALRQVIERKYPKHMPEFEIALHTGMRRSEQYGMEWDRLDFDTAIITVPRSKHGEVRYVRMNSRVQMILSAAKDRSTGTGRVFACKSPRPWFEPAVRAAGLKDFTWHCLRHTFISRLIMAGVDLRTAQELAGHKTIDMTCRYAHLSAEHQQTAVERLVTLPSATRTATDEKDKINGQQLVVQ